MEPRNDKEPKKKIRLIKTSSYRGDSKYALSDQD